jgi:hypothetical protein
MNCHGEYVDNVNDLKPAVIHVVRNREANTWPPGLEEFARAYTGELPAE